MVAALTNDETALSFALPRSKSAELVISNDEQVQRQYKKLTNLHYALYLLPAD